MWAKSNLRLEAAADMPIFPKSGWRCWNGKEFFFFLIAEYLCPLLDLAATKGDNTDYMTVPRDFQRDPQIWPH